MATHEKSADALCSEYSYTHTLSATAYISSVYFGTFVKAVKFPVKSKCGRIHSKVSGTGLIYIFVRSIMINFKSKKKFKLKK